MGEMTKMGCEAKAGGRHLGSSRSHGDLEIVPESPLDGDLGCGGLSLRLELRKITIFRASSVVKEGALPT